MVQEGSRGTIFIKRYVARFDDKKLQGSIPLIIYVNNADIMATLLKLKVELEDKRGSHMKLVFAGATEAHLLAKHIGALDSIHVPSLVILTLTL